MSATHLPPIDIEYKIENKEILSETDTKGIITYANEYFTEISGYKEEELIGSNHNIIRHPCMPKTVFKILWQNLQSGKEYSAIVKNLRKDGKYYWVYSTYKPLYNKEGAIRGYRSSRRPVNRKHITVVEGIYTKLFDMEKTKGLKEAEMFIELKLHQDGFHDYKEFVEDLYEKKLKGVFGTFFNKLFNK